LQAQSINQNIQRAKNIAEEKVQEFIKCKTNFDYFCNNYIYIELPGGDMLLHPYQKQKELCETIQKHKNVLVLKSRQIGISTVLQAYCAWLTNFYDNVVIGIISKDGREATDFARSIRGMIEKLPAWMKPKRGASGPGFDKYTEQSFILTNGSKVFAATVNPKAPSKTLRGKAITFLIIDEAAFIEYVEDAWTSMVPALATSQRHARQRGIPHGTIILSTPNKTVGTGKWFYSKYMSACSGTDIFKPFIIHWKQVKELAGDPEWYSNQCRMFDNDPRKIQQELELKFLPTSGSFFDEKTCMVLQELVTEPKETFKLFNGEVWKFKDAEPGKFYLIGVDTAPEHGEDRSAATVWDFETLEQVWEYQGKCKVEDFIKVIKYACGNYQNAIVVVEDNSYGNQVVETINSSEYNHMLYKQKIGDRIRPGLNTNIKTRPLMIDALYSYISQFPEMVKSRRLALELVGLISKPNGKVEADIGCTDDIALSTALAFYVRKWDPPLSINLQGSEAGDFLKEIMGLNTDNQRIKKPDILPENSQIIKDIRKKIEDGDAKGFTDILGMYRG